MFIYNLYIYDKLGTLLYYREWNRSKQSGISMDEEAKLVYGMLFSIRSFVSRASPWDPKEGFQWYKTNKYTLHYLEVPSGVRFLLNTDNSSTGVREFLQTIYTKLWVEYVVRNPLWKIGTPVTSGLFETKLNELYAAYLT